MTAEIAIINKSAIALASDSAVTIGSKIYSSVNKLFMLSKYEPIGIMIYGTGSFMGVPWETIIKLFRAELDEDNKPALEDYSNKLIEFIIENFAKTPEVQVEIFRNLVNTKFLEIWRIIISAEPEYLVYILDQISEDYGEDFLDPDEKDDSILENRQITIYGYIVKDQWKKIYKKVTERWDSIEKKDFEEVYSAYNDIITKELSRFEGLPLSKESWENLKNIAIYSFYESFTGVVIAGFGTTEIFPSVYTYTIAGVVDGNLKFEMNVDESIVINNEVPSWIIPFAQHEMVDAFLEGVTPQYHNESENYLKKVFDVYPKKIIEIIGEIDTKVDKPTIDKVMEKIEEIKEGHADLINDYNKDMKEKKNENFFDILNALTSLPVDEMASMAESLVHITSLKRKFTYGEIENVGGAIDVAVISKGDGFVWIKRKHYFDQQLNHHFFKTYFDHWTLPHGKK